MTARDVCKILFEPLRIGSVSLKSRLAMSPMTRNFAPGGIHGPGAVDYYERRAAGGIGLIISEGVPPLHPLATDYPRLPALETEEQREPWRAIARAVRKHGTHMLVQLWHVGMLRDPTKTQRPDLMSIGPSGIFPEQANGLAMTQSDIDGVIDSFARSAVIVKDLGFSGIELHAAHGYLFDQFFWGETNRRTDRYGGDIGQRTRFAVEAVGEIRRRVGPDFLISLRFSQFKPPNYTARLAHSPKELEAFLTPLAASGIDVIHPSTRRFWLPEFEGSDLPLAGWTRKITGLPTIAVGSVGLNSAFDPRQGSSQGAERADDAALDDLAERLVSGEFDIAAIGRSLLANPDWGNKVAEQGAAGLRAYDKHYVENLL